MTESYEGVSHLRFFVTLDFEGEYYKISEISLAQFYALCL